VTAGERRGGWLIFLTPVIWGTTFPAGKVELERLSLLPFTAWSRALGAAAILVALPLLLRRERTRTSFRRLLFPGAVLGGIMTGAYLLQSAGLARTTATNAGFITGLYVVFAPILGMLVLRQRSTAWAWVAVAISIVGLALLSVPGPAQLRVGVGDLLVLGSAVGWAAHIVAVASFVDRYPAIPLSLAQMLAASAFHLLLAAPGGLETAAAIDVWPMLVITGVLGSGVAFTLQVVAQGTVSPTRAAVILAGESVVAAAVAAVWLGERLGLHQWAGATLALAAMVISEVGARRAPEARLDPATVV
jgi:drug/metabolite transporter (DMT)-like permease